MSRLYLILTLIIFALTASNCDVFSEVSNTATVEPEPATTTPTIEPATPEATASDTPLPPPGSPDGPPTLTLPAPEVDSDAAITHMPAGTAVIITYIDMKNETAGWAIGGENDPGNHIIFTQDGGQTWRDVTPPEAAPTGGESAKIAHAFFLDADNAWVTYSYEEFFDIPDLPIVWRTSDSGATWQPSAYLEMRGASMEFYSPQFMQFVDPQHGWLLAAVGAGMSHSYSVLFRTSDGGASWARIIDPFSSQDLHNCCKTGMVFVDSLTGIMTSEQGPYTYPYITWTLDGGETWLAENLPAPEDNLDQFENAYCETHSPKLLYPSSQYRAVHLGVTCRQYDEAGNVILNNFMYTSIDAGESWSSIEYPGGIIRIYGFDFVMALGRNIYKYSINPSGWILVKTVNWDGQFSFVKLENDYSGVQFGWVVARNDADENAFLTTTDGGETWREIEPEIVE